MDDRLWLERFNQVYNSMELNINENINPIFVGFKITEKCNQNCKHCWAKSGTFTPSYEEVIRAMELIKKFNPIHITLTGGEPLLHEHFVEILKKAKELFPLVEIFTNGTLIKDKINDIKKILTEDDYIQVSVDGLQDSYREQRGKDDFLKVYNNIKLLVNNGIKVRVNMVVTHYNLNDVIDIYLKFRDIGVNVLSFSPVYPLRRGEKIINLIDYDKYYDKIKELNKIVDKEEKIKVRSIIPIEIQSKEANINFNAPKDFKIFNCDILHWTIDARGNIYHFMDHYTHEDLKIGNIYTDTINYIKETDKIIQSKIIYHKARDSKCLKCSRIFECSGMAYFNSYKDLAHNYWRCTFSE